MEQPGLIFNLKNTKNNTVKYACCRKCSAEKYKNTCLEKYDVVSVSQLESSIIKTKATKLSRYEKLY